MSNTKIRQLSPENIVDKDIFDKYNDFISDFKETFTEHNNNYYLTKYSGGKDIGLSDDFLNILRESKGELGSDEMLSIFDKKYDYDKLKEIYDSPRYNLNEIQTWEWKCIYFIKEMHKKFPGMIFTELENFIPDFINKKRKMALTAFEKPEISIKLYLTVCTVINDYLNNPKLSKELVAGLYYWFGNTRNGFKTLDKKGETQFLM